MSSVLAVRTNRSAKQFALGYPANPGRVGGADGGRSVAGALVVVVKSAELFFVSADLDGEGVEGDA